MEMYTFEEVLDRHYGPIGSPERDRFESKVKADLHAYYLGEAIKKARLQQNLTQEELGEKIGVNKTRISKLERGYSITIPTMRRVFQALGVATASIDFGEAIGKVALW